MRLRRALGEFVVDGIETTMPLFDALLDEPDIASGRLRHPLAGTLARKAGLSRRHEGRHARASRPSCCCGPMPAASSRWRNPPTRRASSGSSRSGAASCRSTASTSPARLAPRHPRKALSTIRIDTDFEEVIDACADRPETWINAEIRALYVELHRLGMPIRSRSGTDGALVGGLYGVALGGAFFGESMFSRRRDASKIALIDLVARLRAGGFAPARHAVRHRPSRQLRRRRDRAAPSTAGGSPRALRRPRDFDALPATAVTSGIAATHHPDVIARMVQRRERR